MYKTFRYLLHVSFMVLAAILVSLVALASRADGADYGSPIPMPKSDTAPPKTQPATTTTTTTTTYYYLSQYGTLQQSSCPGGVCPVPSSTPTRWRLFR